jgi:hypothetical protein
LREPGLLDEIVLHVAPVLLGERVRLFTGEGAGRVELERVSVGAAEQLTDLRFGVRERAGTSGARRRGSRPSVGGPRRGVRCWGHGPVGSLGANALTGVGPVTWALRLANQPAVRVRNGDRGSGGRFYTCHGSFGIGNFARFQLYR